MATNPYFNNFEYRAEQRLLDDLNREVIQIKGIDVLFMPRTLVAEDKLLGEDTLSAFNDAYPIEMYVDTVDNFGGPDDGLAKFGLEIRDSMDLIVSVTRFDEVTDIEKPLKGDLIYFPLSKGLFEIMFVEDEQPFYPLGTTPVFKMTCELFEYSGEDLDTDVSDIDKIQDTFDNITDSSSDPFADNTIIETEADNILDFTENNPFGEF